MKRLLILGASIAQKPVYDYANSRGYCTIAFDMNPDAVLKNYANEFYQVSTTDTENMIEKAKGLNIDGVLTYASDPSAPGAAFIGNSLSLTANPFKSVLTLCRKDLFRKFLKKHGFNIPYTQSFSAYKECKKELGNYKFPIIIKPADSSGSRGVTKVESYQQNIETYFKHALSFSKAKSVVVEEFIKRAKYQVAGDGFMVNGELVFRSFANEHFNTNLNGLVPVGESFPSVFCDEVLDRAHEIIQRIMTLLDMQAGALNFDFIIDEKGEIYILEIGPRNGGNLIPEVIKYANNVDLIQASAEIALGNRPKLEMNKAKGFYASYMIHSDRSGYFKEIELDPLLSKKIISKNIGVTYKEKVECFDAANKAIGSMIISFDSQDEMLYMMDNMHQYIQVITTDTI